MYEVCRHIRNKIFKFFGEGCLCIYYITDSYWIKAHDACLLLIQFCLHIWILEYCILDITLKVNSPDYIINNYCWLDLVIRQFQKVKFVLGDPELCVLTGNWNLIVFPKIEDYNWHVRMLTSVLHHMSEWSLCFEKIVDTAFGVFYYVLWLFGLQTTLNLF